MTRDDEESHAHIKTHTYTRTIAQTHGDFILIFCNLRVFIKESPQQEEQEILRSKDTQFAAVKLPKCIDGSGAPLLGPRGLRGLGFRPPRAKGPHV
jgi:hypothetical protein